MDEPHRVVERADATTDGERHEDGLRDAADHVEHDRTALVAGGDVEEDEFVGPLRLVAGRHRHGVAGIDEIEKPCALHDSAAFDVEAGDDAFGEHGRSGVPQCGRVETAPGCRVIRPSSGLDAVA